MEQNQLHSVLRIYCTCYTHTSRPGTFKQLTMNAYGSHSQIPIQARQICHIRWLIICHIRRHRRVPIHTVFAMACEYYSRVCVYVAQLFHIDLDENIANSEKQNRIRMQKKNIYNRILRTQTLPLYRARSRLTFASFACTSFTS